MPRAYTMYVSALPERMLTGMDFGNFQALDATVLGPGGIAVDEGSQVPLRTNYRVRELDCASTPMAAGDLVTLAATFTDPGSDDTHTFLRQVTASNDEMIADDTAADFSFVPGLEGIYTVVLTVTDDDGDSGSDEVVILVENPLP